MERDLSDDTVPVGLSVRRCQVTALCRICQWICFALFRFLEIGNKDRQTKIRFGDRPSQVIDVRCVQTVIAADRNIIHPYLCHTRALQIKENIFGKIGLLEMNLFGIPGVALEQIRIGQSTGFALVGKCSLLCHGGCPRQCDRIAKRCCIKCVMNAGAAGVKPEVPDTL